MDEIAYQGVPGAFSEEAAIALRGEAALRVPVATFDEVCDAVASGRTRFGVLPIENTLAGSVQAVYDLLGRKDVRILGETTVRVSHVLVSVPGATIDGLRRVLSHPIALAQCERFFREHPAIEPVAAYNTAGAIADVVAKGSVEEAAIGSRRAAQRYGGAVLAEDVEDHRENWTRFLLVGRGDEAPSLGSGPRKTTLVFTLAHRPGSLCAALRAFSDRAIDLTRIESRPLPGRPFEYAFYADVVSAPGDPLEAALGALADAAHSLRVFGTYPCA
ncbi:MAG: prephenate dehydratase [Deltaproteobacteria bacterium]|nr:prephenate dehydratase [Deltaproteobacteria bacterium]